MRAGGCPEHLEPAIEYVDIAETDALMIAITAAVIDALWYTVVAVLLSQSAWSGRFMQQGGLLDRGFGVILIVLSAAVLWSIWQPN